MWLLTDTARGVDTELRLAREVGTKYYFLRAYNDKNPINLNLHIHLKKFMIGPGII